MKHTIAFILAMISFSTVSYAEQLQCTNIHSFSDSDLKIQNLTKGVTIELSMARFDFKFLSDLTGRDTDRLYLTKTVNLYLPKTACGLDSNTVTKDFSCVAPQAIVEITGTIANKVNDGSGVLFEKNTKKIRLFADIDLKSTISTQDQKNYGITLSGTLTNPAAASRSVVINANMDCRLN